MFSYFVFSLYIPTKQFFYEKKIKNLLLLLLLNTAFQVKKTLTHELK